MANASSLPLRRLFGMARSRRDPELRTEETALLRRVQNRDEQAFDELVQRYWKRAFWIAYDVLYDHDRAEDVAQEAFVKVHRAIHTFELGRDFASWMHRITLNLAIDHRRRKQRDRSIVTDKVVELVDARKAYVENEEQAATIERVETVLQTLPDKYRTPLVMKDIDGLSVDEVARILDVSYSTVRWRLHKARKVFRERWTRLLRKEERELR